MRYLHLPIAVLLAMISIVGCEQMATTPDQDANASDLACLPDCADANLVGASLAAANLREANLSNANLAGADLRNADLDGADLRGADLRNVVMISTALRGADLSGADLTGANLNNADAAGATLRGANLTRANLRAATLVGAVLHGANVSAADLRMADLTGVDLSAVQGCDITGRVPGCVAYGTLVWPFEDSCSDGYTTQLRFFDAANGLIWPSNDEVYILEGSNTYSLRCRTGADVCYGAQPNNPFTNAYWGVGIDGDQSCTDCCYTCPAGEVTLPQRTLTCS